MVKIRLKRQGKKFTPSYRIIATQARSKRDGRAIEDLGFYSPMSKEIKVKKDRIEYWLGVGAKPTSTVANILIKESIIKPSKNKKSTYSKKPKRKSQERAEAKKEKAKETK